MLPTEHFSAQGLPAFLFEDEAFAISPVKWLLGTGNNEHVSALARHGETIPNLNVALGPGDIRSLTGNQMNMAQVGAAMMLAVATSQPWPK